MGRDVAAASEDETSWEEVRIDEDAGFEEGTICDTDTDVREGEG